MVTQGSHEGGDALLARTLINASGLSAQLMLNSLVPADDRIPMYYARGSYAAYNGPGVSHVSRLIYPCPSTDKSEHAFQALGTHLTLDLNGNVKFGPDLQWISPDSHSPPSPHPVRANESDDEKEEFSYDEEDVDFWKRHLVPDDSQLTAMYHAVRSFLPNVDASKFRPDYVGVRPKLVPPWGGFQDFVFRTDYPSIFLRSEARGSGRPKPGEGAPMISLMGFESPGLTASLAIAERVVDMLEGSR